MRKEVVIIGKGGQGILLAGHLLSDAIAKNTKYHVINMAFYSAETRGTESRTEIVITDNEEEADYFMARRPDIAVFMHPEYISKYVKNIKESTIVLVDSSFNVILTGISPEIKIHKIPFTLIAEQKLGTSRVANVVMLGYLLALTNIIDLESLKKSIKENVKEQWIEINIKALELGYSEGIRRRREIQP
ncbi:MAG: 2-oxoglutarate oxidoreductase [Thermoprotei archaeon]|nr:MAG: 2-oxoglutarate oxidoreductase [Thermoprotei archaeon]